MTHISHAGTQVDLKEIKTPRSSGSILTGRRLPAFAARLGAWFASWYGRPLRFSGTVIVARHEDVRQVLDRDLDFRIAPVNERRIDEVNGPFVLGMDRGSTLSVERTLLYRALHRVDMASLRSLVETEALRRIVSANDGAIDVVGDYSRPIAAMTARQLFGVSGPTPKVLMDVTRAVFAHTFLNLSDDKAVRDRALLAGTMMKDWISDEVKTRIEAEQPGEDLLGQMIQLLRLQSATQVDADLVRRTIGGMLVGSIDTTATSVAKIVAVLGGKRAFQAKVALDLNSPELLRGWCWEALRRWPHNPILLRQAIAPVTLNGLQIKADDRVVAWTQAAMLDPSVFPDPSWMRPDRPIGNYLHFGGTLHVCAGRSVNGFQIPTLVGALLKRGIRSSGKIEWAGPFPDKLMVVFDR